MTAELAERARPQAARAKPGQGAPKGRPRCGASWTAAAAWAMQEVFLYNIGRGGPVWSGGVLFLHRAGGCGIGWGSGKIPAKRASNFIDIDSRRRLRKRTETFLGGDERMAWLAESLRREGYIIRLAALLPPAPLKNRLPQPETPDRLLPESETVILAVPTVGPDGMLRTPTVPECYPLAECLRRLPEGAMVLGGTLPPDCRKIVEERHLAYTDLLALPELQELNAIATAEGAVALAMREQNTTLFDTRCVVLGYGRCGSALCRRLAALGAKVTAAARRREQLARIYADGHTPCDINKLSPALDGCEVVFNTVPAPVLPEELLRRLPPEALVVELASAPGGCDAAVAEAMGLRYRNAPGLPGKAAPRAAGEYLGQVIRGLPHWEE